MPTDGTKITYSNGKYTIPDNPIIPFIEGDGTGRDIWRASRKVFDAAVAKASGRMFPPEERRAIAHGADAIDLINSGLEETMIGAYHQIRELWKRDPRVTDLRTAAFLNAITKVANSYLELGIFP